ncbi:hypothetical protein ACFLVS_05245 [Chloroflexota bacterium]
MSMFFSVPALVSVIFGIVFMIMITSFLSNRGIKINYIFLRLYIIKYVHQYRKITMEENGKPGNLFYAFIVSMNLALVLAVIGIILKNTTG